MGRCTIKNHLRRTRGFTLVEVIMTVGITSFILLIVMTGFAQIYQEKRRSDFLLALTELRLTFQQATLKSDGWSATMLQNSSMACFRGSMPSSCLALNGVPPQDMKLYSASGLIYDSMDPSMGYTMSGAPCSTYGSSDCVLKPSLKWSVQCNLSVDSTCSSPLVMIDLDYTYVGPNVGPVNFRSYGFQISHATFPIQATPPCSGVVPVCTASQAAICESGSWVCREFGL